MDQINYNIPLISVIMPVYNTEKYLAESLYSIINQTIKDIEIIIINDGSTDNSLKIATSIAESDNRIKIYSKANEGPSESRNLGLKKALGKYIYFMDSDDLLEKETLAICYQICEKEHLDFVFFDATAFKEDKSESLNDYYLRNEALEENKVYTGIEVLNKLMSKNLYRSAVWLCFIQKEYLDKIPLDFYPGIIHEDELFSAKLHLSTNKVQYINKPFFRRRIRPNSITSNKFSFWNIKCYLIVIEKLLEYGKNKNEEIQEMINKLCIYILNPAIYRARNFSFTNRIKIMQICIDNNLKKYISSKNIAILLFPFLIKIKSIFK